MLRIITIAVISLLSLFPIVILSTNYLGLSDNQGFAAGVAIGWIILPAILLKVWRYKPDPSRMPIDPDDPIMLEQITIAKREIKRFLKGLETGKLEAFVKFPLEINGNIEHVWGVAHHFQSDNIIVTIASEIKPKSEQDKFSRMPIPLDDIEDWTLTNSKGLTHGGYSNLALAKIYERDYGRLPEKYVHDLKTFLDFEWSQHTIYN